MKERMWEFPLILVALVWASGCASQTPLLQRTSAKRIGCDSETAAIRDVHRERTRPRTWTVTCEERTWACSNDWGRVSSPLAASDTSGSLD
jgi:hypothetical protein